MYDELVKRLREVSCGAKDTLWWQAADAIEELQAQINGWIELERKALIKSVPKWISVTERLPEKDIEVLVFAEGKIEGFFGDTVIAISKRYDLKIFTDSEGVEVWQSPWQYFLTDYEITHWMPLPEQPKEE